MSEPAMSSNRSYLLHAMYDWISDNGLTPYLLVDANAPGVRVPRGVIKEGRVVLNVAARAVTQLDVGRECVRFLARFSGVSQVVEVPMGAILAIYAHENGQGMMFPAEDSSTPPPVPATEAPPVKKGPSLRVVK